MLGLKSGPSKPLTAEGLYRAAARRNNLVHEGLTLLFLAGGTWHRFGSQGPDSRETLDSLTVVYFVLLPYEPLVAQKVYVDENALMPAIAVSQLEESYFTAMQQSESAIRQA